MFILALGLLSCEGDDPGPDCDGTLSITVASIVDASCGDNNGSINLSSSGASGAVTYQLNGGAEQGAATFSDIGQGNYTLRVTDENGCNAEVVAEVATGLTLADIKPIITTSCAISNCHNGDRTNIPNFTQDANIIARAGTIKTRTNNLSMPPAGQDDLTASQIQMIACWVDDGAPQ